MGRSFLCERIARGSLLGVQGDLPPNARGKDCGPAVYRIARHVSTTQSAWSRSASAICQAVRTRFERVPRRKTERAIEHVVIIVKENHGFDNYFGTFPGAAGARLPRSPNPPHQDPNHRHDAWLTRKTTAVGEQFVEQDIPAYFAYARQFTLCDNYFTDVAGPSTPNHIMLITADSPIIVNPPRYRLPVGEQIGRASCRERV